MANRQSFMSLFYKLMLTCVSCLIASQLVGVASGTEVGQPSSASARSVAIQVPPGFVVELVAGPPLVERPMMASFDDQGRLFVCDSSGFNLLKGSSEILVKDPPHAIRMLEDADGDGRFDKSTLFADKMTFPMGALWHDGALYTASAPSIWRLKDTDGDGVADERHEFITRVDFGGNACDVHGPFLGPDGWIYWANCQRGFDIRDASGKVLAGKAAGLFRVRPDGTDVEVVCAGGMDNPVEVAFTPEGEAFATVNLFQGGRQPRNDAIMHCVEGGVFPYKEISAQFKRTGDFLPSMIDLGWVAPAGLMRYRGEALGSEYHDNLFSAHFNRRRVQRHVVERVGATFRGSCEDFVVSDDMDFHPTDILEDADGSLLLIDTGGWFLRGCPTSQIAKPEIKGAIYRIRRADAPQRNDPRGLELPWDKLSPRELTALLDDPRWPVRDRAVQHLGQRGAAAVADLAEAASPRSSVQVRRNAVWALTRIDTAKAREAVVASLSDSDPGVRLAAAHSLGLNRVSEGQNHLARIAVVDDSPAVRREAATALGRIRQSASVPALLEALRAGGDRFLEHAQIYAMIQIDDRAATMNGLQDSDPRVRRAALIALDKMDAGNLTRDLVTPHLECGDTALQRTALTVIKSRPEWADSVVELIRQWLGESELPEGRQELLQSVVPALGTNPAIQRMVADVLHDDKTSNPVRLLLLESMIQAPLDQLPASWLAELDRALGQSDERVLLQAVAVLRARGVTTLDDAVIRLGQDPRQPAELRLAALRAVAPRLTSVDLHMFEYLYGQLDPNLPPLVRLTAADTLSTARLDDSQLAKLADALAVAGAMETPHLVGAFERSGSLVVGKSLISSLESSPSVESLPADSLRRALKDYPDEVHQLALPLLKRLEVDAEKQQAKLAELEPMLLGGNALQGRGVFYGTKGACANCHTVAAKGGNVGPDLSKIGAIRTSRDLLESLVFPGASFVRSYEPYVIMTTDGIVHTGLMGHETPAAIQLITAERTERRIPRSMIEEIQPGRVSIMPQGLDAQLTPQELRDLIAYLASLK